MARRLGRLLVAALVGAGVLAVLLLGPGRLPQGTSVGSLAVRAAAAVGLGLILLVFVRRMLLAMSAPPPAPPEMVDARATQVVYRCPVCGTVVRLEIAATGKAPKHCGEEMETSLA